MLSRERHHLSLGEAEGEPAALNVRGEAREEPGVHTLRLHVYQLGKPGNGSIRVFTQPGRTIQKMLGGIVGAIAHKGLGIDREPRLPHGSEHVAGMEVGGEQRVVAAGLPQLDEALGAGVDEPGVGPR
jgi:hypothetical protein